MGVGVGEGEAVSKKWRVWGGGCGGWVLALQVSGKCHVGYTCYSGTLGPWLKEDSVYLDPGERPRHCTDGVVVSVMGLGCRTAHRVAA